MKTTNALMAAALAGVFAAGATVTQASIIDSASVFAEEKEKEKCPAKEEKKEGTIL